MEKKKGFIISPVRNLTEEVKNELLAITERLESEGWEIHLPYRDTIQEQCGLDILRQNMNAMIEADKIFIYYDVDSTESKFDLGVTMVLHKPLELLNKIERKEVKCFGNAILDYIKFREVLEI